MYGSGSGREESNGWDSIGERDGVDVFLDDIEKLLMTEDVDHYPDVSSFLELPDGFFSDILLDSPLVDPNNSSPDSGSIDKPDAVAPEADDPTTKKHRRQLRNRDAAVRSRERKKMYVKDLEIKSRYLEGECRRLGILLQCCSAENQALRLSLHNAKAVDASMTKQESAVLVLESLLLGSLLWFLGIVCLFRPLSPPGKGGDKVQESQVLLKRPPNNDKAVRFLMSELVIMSRRCKGSKRRMKQVLIV